MFGLGLNEFIILAIPIAVIYLIYIMIKELIKFGIDYYFQKKEKQQGE